MNVTKGFNLKETKFSSKNPFCNAFPTVTGPVIESQFTACSPENPIQEPEEIRKQRVRDEVHKKFRKFCRSPSPSTPPIKKMRRQWIPKSHSKQMGNSAIENIETKMKPVSTFLLNNSPFRKISQKPFDDSLYEDSESIEKSYRNNSEFFSPPKSNINFEAKMTPEQMIEWRINSIERELLMEGKALQEEVASEIYYTINKYRMSPSSFSSPNREQFQNHKRIEEEIKRRQYENYILEINEKRKAEFLERIQEEQLEKYYSKIRALTETAKKELKQMIGDFKPASREKKIAEYRRRGELSLSPEEFEEYQNLQKEEKEEKKEQLARSLQAQIEEKQRRQQIEKQQERFPSSPEIQFAGYSNSQNKFPPEPFQFRPQKF